MQKIALSIFFFLSLYSISSQEGYKKIASAKKQNPTYIYNKTIIGNDKILPNNEESKELIMEISVLKYKPNKLRDNFYNLTEHGIIFVDLKKDLDAKSQSELNEFFGLHSRNKIYIDGYLIDNKNYKIATKSIVELELIDPSSQNGLKTKVLNIWTLKKEERYID